MFLRQRLRRPPPRQHAPEPARLPARGSRPLFAHARRQTNRRGGSRREVDARQEPHHERPRRQRQEDRRRRPIRRLGLRHRCAAKQGDAGDEGQIHRAPKRGAAAVGAAHVQEADVAAQFSALPFDHILFTGSTAVGKHVMRAAADNLTPVTLELGGKSPAIIDQNIDIKTAAKQILFGKCVNSGQTCVAPDYVLCPSDKVQALTDALSAQFNTFYPDFDGNNDYTHVVNDRQYDRIQSWLDEAANAGANIISVTDKPYTDYKDGRRKLPLQMVLNADESLNVMQQEIFGPILPIIPYQSIDQAIEYVQQRPRPLALYILSFNKAIQQKILQHTHAGGVTINDTLLHFGQKDMPVGGVGPSGMGYYHGIEGFKTFSSVKGVHAKGKIDAVSFIHPPYGKSLLNLVLKLFVR